MARIFTKGDNRFSIDDAFQEEMDEIKNYNNSTSEKSPLKPKSLTNSSIALNAEDCVVNLDNVPSSQTLNMNGVNNIMSNNIISYNILHNNQYKSKYDDVSIYFHIWETVIYKWKKSLVFMVQGVGIALIG